MKSRTLGWFLGSCLAGALVVACGSGAPDGDADLVGSGGTGGGSTDQGSGGGSGGGADIPVSLVSVCFDYVKAQCERRNECLGFEVSDCTYYGRDKCPDLLFSEGSTRTVESVAACTQDWTEMPCEEIVLYRVPSCIAGGTKAVGEACIFSQQCLSGFCSGTGYSCGACLSVAESGGECSVGTVECPDGEECGGGGGTCVARAPATPPEEPTIDAAGEACFDYDAGTCAEGTFCSLPSADAFISLCNPAPAAGDACALIYTDHYECPPGLYCDDTIHCATSPGDGEPCAAVPNNSGMCAPGTFCWDTICRAPVPAGANCASAPCADSFCDEDDICKTQIRLGQDCSGAFSLCEPHTLCEAGTCVADNTLTQFEEACTE